MYAAGVCLVVHQDDENVIGVMLNRPMKPSPQMLLELLKQNSASQDGETDAKDDRNQAHSNRLPAPASPPPTESPTSSLTDSPLGMLHFGGPISGPVVAIHQDQKQAEAETGDGIYVAAQMHHLENLVRDRQSPYRLIVGHLAWKPQQLEYELAAGVWHRVPATLQTVFSSHEEMWPGIIRRATSNSMSKWLGIPDAKGIGELN
jgi:putative transcriptional regulator